MDDGDVADLAAIDPCFQIRYAKARVALRRQTLHAGLLDRVDDAVGFGTVIAIGLPRMMCLPARADRTARSGISATGAAMWTMSMSGRSSSGVAGIVGLDAERARERVQLLSIVPGDSPQLRFLVFRQCTRETVRRIPVPEAENPHSPSARHASQSASSRRLDKKTLIA